MKHPNSKGNRNPKQNPNLTLYLYLYLNRNLNLNLSLTFSRILNHKPTPSQKLNPPRSRWRLLKRRRLTPRRHRKRMRTKTPFRTLGAAVKERNEAHDNFSPSCLRVAPLLLFLLYLLNIEDHFHALPTAVDNK